MKALIVAALLFVTPAVAADKALVLNDSQQNALKQALDAAIRANGLSAVSRNSFVLSDMLDAAGVVTAHTEDKPKSEPKAEDKPKEEPPS